MARLVDVPYRVDVGNAGRGAFGRFVELGAIDVELAPDGGLGALMPDHVAPAQIARALGVDDVMVSPAHGRDSDSVWVLRPRPVQVGRVRIVPATYDSEAGSVGLADAAAFGTGLHPTTALCVEALDELIDVTRPDAVLDVGTGSGILALAALTLGVPRAIGLDIDRDALRVAAENARLNAVDHRFSLAHGGPETVIGRWPLVLANVLAAPLIEMAPVLVRRVGNQGTSFSRAFRRRSRTTSIGRTVVWACDCCAR